MSDITDPRNPEEGTAMIDSNVADFPTGNPFDHTDPRNDAPEPTVIALRPATNDDASYGITARSRFVYRVTGKSLHNPHSPHRVVVWDNTGRPNPRNGQQVRYSQYGRIDGGDGRYLDPNHHATDAPTSYLLSAEATVLSAHGDSTGTEASGQVYADETLAVGQTVVLRYPDGTLSAPLWLSVRPLADPQLLPVE